MKQREGILVNGVRERILAPAAALPFGRKAKAHGGTFFSIFTPKTGNSE